MTRFGGRKRPRAPVVGPHPGARAPVIGRHPQDVRPSARAAAESGPQLTLPSDPVPGRLVVVYGAPLTGVSTLLGALRDVLRSNVQFLDGKQDWQGALTRAEALRAEGLMGHPSAPDVVFLDAPMLDVSRARELAERRLVGPGEGYLIRLWTQDEEILRRGRVAARMEVSAASLGALRRQAAETEQFCHAHGLPFAMLPYEATPQGMEAVAIGIMRRAQLRES